MENETFWRVVIDVNSEIEAHKMFKYLANHIGESGIKEAEYYVESGTTVAGFDKNELRIISED